MGPGINTIALAVSKVSSSQNANATVIRVVVVQEIFATTRDQKHSTKHTNTHTHFKINAIM